MAENLKTQNSITIVQTEVNRANTAFTQVDTLNAQVVTLQTQKVALEAEVKRLTDLLNPAPPPPPPPPPPPTGKTGLYVDGTKFRSRHGQELRLRCVEVMVNGNVAGYGYEKFLKQIKNDLGANAVSPLFQGQYGSVAEVKKFCDIALTLGMCVGVNGDHQDNGRSWLCQSAMVSLLNSYPHVYLVCEVETDSDGSPTNAEWVAYEKGKIQAFRNAGLTAPIKAGSYMSGRDVKYPLAAGKEVLAADPLKNVVFTWQAYWKAATGGWQYSESNGFVGGIAGSKAALTACVASGLCFMPGFDFRDDVGLTGEDQLIDHAISLGLSHAHWAAAQDGLFPDNNLYDWDLSPTPAKPTATMIAAKWKAQKASFPDVQVL